jgi:hypothetical protein
MAIFVEDFEVKSEVAPREYESPISGRLPGPGGKHQRTNYHLN